MFGLFPKKTPLQKLQIRYKKAMGEASAMSHHDRKEADLKYLEAETIAKEIDQLMKNTEDIQKMSPS